MTQCELWTDNADFTESNSSSADFTHVKNTTYTYTPGVGLGMVAEKAKEYQSGKSEE